MQIKVLLKVAIMFYMIHVRQMALRFALLDMAILTSQLEIKQWGKSSSKTATFPLKFPSAALIAVNSTDDAGSGNNYDNRIISITTSAITISYGSFRYIVIGK